MWTLQVNFARRFEVRPFATAYSWSDAGWAPAQDRWGESDSDEWVSERAAGVAMFAPGMKGLRDRFPRPTDA